MLALMRLQSARSSALGQGTSEPTKKIKVPLAEPCQRSKRTGNNSNKIVLGSMGPLSGELMSPRVV
jgi:hypothetical protein